MLMRLLCNPLSGVLLSLTIAGIQTFGSIDRAHANSIIALGEIVTYGQVDWGENSDAISLLQTGFATAFASTGGALFVGGTHFMEVDAPDSLYSHSSLVGYLPANGVAAPLNASVIDPETTSSGVFGGDVVALQLDVAFSAAGLLAHHSGVPFGNMVLTGFTGNLAGLNNITVSELLATANAILGGDSTAYLPTDIDPIVASVGDAFNEGVESDFANAHLELPSDTPVSTTPLPQSFLLLFSGLGALGILGRKRATGAPRTGC
jgi:hypothetical protein